MSVSAVSTSALSRKTWARPSGVATNSRAAEAPPAAPADFSERAARFAGAYGFWRGNFSKIERVFGMGNAVQVMPTEDGALAVAFAGGAKQYVEVEENLFRERDPGISLIAGISPRQIAFQEDENGAVTGFVMDGLAFMSLRRLPAYETPSFNFTLLGVALLILLGFALRRFFQRREIAAFSEPDRAAVRAAFYTAAAHLLVVVLGVVVVSAGPGHQESGGFGAFALLAHGLPDRLHGF